jgi:hypothetical protein
MMNLLKKNSSKRKPARLLKAILILLSFIHCLPKQAKAQGNKSTVNIELGLQAHEWTSIYAGIMNSRHLRAPSWKTDLFQTSTFYYENAFLDERFKGAESFGLNFSVGSNFLKLGLDGRYTFFEGSALLYIGPALRVGYKYIWFDAAYQFHPLSNIFQGPRLPLQTIRMRLVANIPIYRKS